MNYNEFYNTFVIEKRVVKNRVIKKRWLEGFTNLDYLFSLISPFIYKSDLKLDIKKETKIVEPGERVAQLVILPLANFDYVQVEKLDETDRGTNRFGSTGTI